MRVPPRVLRTAAVPGLCVALLVAAAALRAHRDAPSVSLCVPHARFAPAAERVEPPAQEEEKEGGRERRPSDLRRAARRLHAVNHSDAEARRSVPAESAGESVPPGEPAEGVE